jgi:uncharacterized repeat protein (TIGR01451 family)
MSVCRRLLAACVFAGLLPAAHAVNLVQEFYLPMPEAQINQANNSIIAGTGTTIASTFSIIVTGNGTVIYYDQWEDGYETDLSNPTQPTTQIWGDGNDAHGIPPGFAHNPLGLPAGTVITLTNNVSLPRNPSQILFDARDRIGANKAIIVTRAGWPIPTGPVFAGAVSVLSTMDYGTNYISPVGQNLTNVNLMKYVGMFIMAAQNNTAVTIDPNGNGIGTTNIVLNQGESYLVNGGIMVGGRVTATKPVQADLLIGHVGATYASDWFTLYPVSAWSSAYYTPVGSAATVNQPAYVYLYNPGASAITINYNTKVGSGSFSVPGTNGVYKYQMPVSSGASFVSAGGQNFYALCTVAANNASDTPWNWGFTLVPKGALTTAATVGWAPGSADGTVDGSPVWVTPLANTTVYVDYHGDTNGPLIDPNGNRYDTNFTVTALQSQKIYDPSKNQTGTRVYTVDGTLITAAWGEDADVAAPGNPYIDAGTTVLPFPVPLLKKSAVIVTDTPPAGLSIGDTIQYTVEIDNKGLLPLGNTVVIDAPSGNLTYVPNSTTLNSNSIPDNASGQHFPLAAPGYTIPVILSQGTSTFQYLAQVNGSGVVSNSVDIGGTTISCNAVLFPPPTNGATVTLNFSDTNGVPVSLYTVGANVYVTMTNAAGNTSSNSVQTIPVTVVDQTHGDLETIILTETGTNTGVFRNIAGLPTSATAGLGQQDGILNVTRGDILSVSYTDPNFGDSATNTAAVQIPTPNKQLYLSVNGSTNGVQDLNRIDPVAYGHSPTRTSVDIGSAGGSGTVTLDATTSGGVNGAATLTVSHTTGAGQNRLMLVAIGMGDSSVNGFTISSVTYSGQSLTNVGSIVAAAGGGGVTATPHAEIWALVNPPSGTANVVITASGTRAINAGVTTFAGVNQASPLGTFVSNSGTTGTSASVTDGGSASGRVEFDVSAVGIYYTTTGTASPAGAPGAGQTSLWSLTNNYATAGQLYVSCSGSTSNAAGTSVTMSRSWTGNYPWAIGAVSINPAAGVGGGTNVTSFTQTPGFYSSFTMPSNNLVTITNFITITNGVMPANPAITATLQYSGTNIITLSNPTYYSASSNLVWSGVLTTNVTVPAGLAITYVISNAQAGVTFHVNYDSVSSPSKITLPASTVIQVNTLGIYDAPYPGGNLVTSPIAGSTLYIRANVSDPFGSYDVTSLGLAITGPSPGSSQTNTLTAGNVVASDNLSKTYEYQWVTGPATGNYNIAVTANEGTEGVTASKAASITTTFLDLGTPSTTEFTSGNNGSATNSYPAGSPVCISVTDLDSITNPAIVQTIIATVTSSAGDSEILTLTETAPNTGIYTACLNTSTSIVGAPNDGTLYAPVGSVLTASYTNPNSASYSSSATATVQPVPGVPGVVMNKTILSPSGGQVGVSNSVIYNLQVVNVGSTTLTNLSVSDNFPSAKLSYSSASFAPNTVAIGLLTWTNLGAFAPGQSTNITVTFTTLAAGTVTNFATANGISATNTSSVTLQVNNAALNVTKILLSPTNTPVAVGSNVVFRITVQNVGNTVVNFLPLEDTFSAAYFQFVSSTVTNNGSGAGSLIWTNLASLAPLATGATITNDVTMKVVGQGSPANNSATVDYATDIFGNPVPTASSTIGVITTSASINGHVYNDINQSGIFTNGDTGLSAVTVQLFTDPNGDGNPSDGTLVQITTTDANGYYELLNLNIGHYVVVETDLPGYASSAPANNRLALNITNLAVVTNANFFDYIPAPSLYSTINGTVWNDVNGNGTNDVGETGLANVEVDLVQDVNTNSLADSGEPVAASVATDASGNYSFAGVTPGHYVIRETDSYGYYSTGDSQGRNDSQISFVSTNGIASTNNNFFDRLSPVAVNDTNSTVYGTPVTIYPLTNDISPNGDALTITNVTSTDGIVVINPGSTNLTFTPTNTGTTTVTYTISDTHGGTSTASISVGVTPAPLSVTANNASRAYGQTNPIFTGTLNGVVNGDNITATYTSAAVTNSPAASYPITPVLADPNGRLVNYTLSSTNGILTVSRTLPVVGWPVPTNIVYGTPLGTNQNNATATTPGSYVYNPTNGTVPAAGTNPLTVVFTPADTNYTAVSLTNVLVVSPAPLSVTANNASRAYGQTNPIFTGTLNGVVNGDNITATYTSAAVTNSPAASYPITPVLADPNGRLVNYTLSSTNGILTVTNAPVASADLMVFLSGPSYVTVGDSFTYTITLTNGGPSTASNVVVSNNLPVGLTFASASGSGVFSNNIVTWPMLAAFANGATTNFTLTVSASSTGQFTNIASASSTTFDPNPTNNAGSSLVLQVLPAASSAQFGWFQGPAVLNPQTGLYEEPVIVTNTGAATVAGVRLYVGGLRSGVTLYNATGTTNGTPYVEYDASLNPVSTVTFTLEFYDANRLAFTNTLTAVEIPFTSLPSAGTNGVAVTTEFMDTRIVGDTRFAIEFPTVPGKSYTILYSTNINAAAWNIATPAVTANANITQWYDDGPPKTISSPMSVNSRFYRVIQN